MSEPRAGRRIADPPSLTALAADELRAMILRGDLAPGDRVVENRLTVDLGISRPPLREALRMLEHEGLVVQTPRRGASVRELTLQDIYEIVTLREQLESMAVRLGVPVRDPALLAPLHEAADILDRQAAAGAEDTAVEDTVRFHRALVGLAGHGRVDEAYRTLSLQLRVVMAMNRRARAEEETLVERAARHRRLVGLVAAGDPEAVLADLHGQGSRSFLARLPESWTAAATPAALAWYAAQRA